jgi:hypothetical protein
MGPLLGMAGLDAAGFAADWGLLCVGVVTTITAAFFGLLLRSRVATVLSAVAGLITTLVFHPWWAFWPEPSDNWEVQEFQDDFRFLAWWWVVGSVGAITACIDAYQRRTRDSRPGEQERV